MEYHDMIVVLQAARDGKELEVRKRPDEDTDKTWRPMPDPHLRAFNFANYEYRLKTKAYANEPPKVTKDKAIEILQALKEGKEIEFKTWQEPTVWLPWKIERGEPGMSFRDFPDFSCYDYRVKVPEPPKPNEIWVNEFRDSFKTGVNTFAYASESQAKAMACSRCKRVAVQYREVIATERVDKPTV